MCPHHRRGIKSSRMTNTEVTKPSNPLMTSTKSINSHWEFFKIKFIVCLKNNCAIYAAQDTTESGSLVTSSGASVWPG